MADIGEFINRKQQIKYIERLLFRRKNKEEEARPIKIPSRTFTSSGWKRKGLGRGLRGEQSPLELRADPFGGRQETAECSGECELRPLSPDVIEKNSDTVNTQK